MRGLQDDGARVNESTFVSPLDKGSEIMDVSGKTASGDGCSRHSRRTRLTNNSRCRFLEHKGLAVCACQH